MHTRNFLSIIAAALLASSAIAAEKGEMTKGDAPKAAAQEESVTVLLLVPVQVSRQALSAGCWAQLYDERNFKGDAFTLIGPVELESADKASGRAFRRKLDSLVTGPKATLTFYEHRMFKDRAVKFGPNSKEGGLLKKLGFSGRVQSVKLECEA
jgi:hypothetical protein